MVAVLLSACPAWAGDGNDTVKVFILAGQSNMEGLGHIRTPAHLGEDPQYGALLKRIRRDDGSGWCPVAEATGSALAVSRLQV